MQVTFNATEARAKFFQILKLAELGVTITIEKKDTNTKFNLQIKETKSVDKLLSELEKSRNELKSGKGKLLKSLKNLR